MLSTGVRTDLGVKIFGSDLNILKDLAVQAEGILKTVKGSADVVAERVTGGNYIDIDVDKEAAARYGIQVGDARKSSDRPWRRELSTPRFRGGNDSRSVSVICVTIGTTSRQFKACWCRG